MHNFVKARRRRKQAEDRRLKVVEQERSVKEDIEKSEDKRNRKFLSWCHVSSEPSSADILWGILYATYYNHHS